MMLFFLRLFFFENKNCLEIHWKALTRVFQVEKGSEKIKKDVNADSRDCSELNASSPDLNQGPLDLQSNALPTELSRLDL